MKNNPDIEKLIKLVIDTAYHLHHDLGPGLLESAYKNILAELLRKKGLKTATEVFIPFTYAGITFHNELRVDLLVEDSLIVELKATETTQLVYKKQLLTYLRATNQRLGLLINFGEEYFKNGCFRVINNLAVK